MTALVLLAGIITALAVYGTWSLVMAGGGPRRGMAPGFDVQAKLSRDAMLRKAATTRPGTVLDRRSPVIDYALEVGRRGWRTLHASLEEVVLVFALPRMGKTALLANNVIDAPGAVVVTSTKVDIFTLTVAMRRRRPVFVFNPDGLGDIASTLRWSPLTGCGDAQTSILRAAYLISGSRKTKGSSEKDFWDGNAHRALRCLLTAAFLADAGMEAVWRWSQDLTDVEPFRVLREHTSTPEGWADELHRISRLNERTLQSIEITLSSALAFMADPRLADATSPREGEEAFDAETFIRAQGTLYLLGKDREFGPVGPLFAALAGHVFETAQAMASHYEGGRLNPPLTGVLDEAATVCRLPLERLTADCGGRGIPLVIAVQGPDQLYDVWGQDAGRIIWTNAGMKLAFGGLTVGKHLQELADLCGTRIERRRSHSTGSGGRSWSDQTEHVPVMRAAEIRELPDFTVLVLFRNLGPLVARIRPVWTRRDVRQAAAAAAGPQDPPTGPLAPIIRLADRRRRPRSHRRAS